MRAWWVFLSAMLCIGCSTYSIQQTSLVPAAVMTPTPASTVGPDFALLGSYVTSARDRDALKDASLWVARGQAVGTFEYAFRPASVRVTGFNAPARGAYRAQPDGLPNPGGSTYGGGPGAVIRLLRDDPRNNLTLTGDVFLVIAPSRIQSRCVDSCVFANGGGSRRDMSGALMLNSGLQYRFRMIEQLGFTAGVGLQTLVRNREFRPTSTLGGRSKVRMGAPHPILDVGVELTPLPWLSLSPVISWIAPPTPIRYGPSVSLVLRFHVPVEPTTTPAQSAASTAY